MGSDSLENLLVWALAPLDHEVLEVMECQLELVAYVKYENHLQEDILQFLVEEIGILRTKIQQHGTGHIYTAISVLESRVKEVKEKLNNET